MLFKDDPMCWWCGENPGTLTHMMAKQTFYEHRKKQKQIKSHNVGFLTFKEHMAG